jgi:diguanylate cyclase (GGDEF)-like protein
VEPANDGVASIVRLLGEAQAAPDGERRQCGLLVVRITNFERVAAALGPRVAEQVVATAMESLERVARPTDKVLRIGDARFAFLVRPARNEGVLIVAAHRVGEALAKPLAVGGASVNVAARIGIAPAPAEKVDAERWFQQAEVAVLAAMHEDTAYAVYAPAQTEQAADLLELELDLEAAVRANELELFFQPKVAAATYAPCGAEALLRWTHPRRGRVSPDVFLPVGGKPGLIEPLTSFVLHTALRLASEWPIRWGPLGVAVNVTPNIVEGGELVELVESALGMWGVEPARLCIEITEGAIMRHPQSSLALLHDLRAQGVRVAIDDFGTGYSSLAYFKNIPADELKIDKSFVMNMLKDRGDRMIVRTVIELAKSFGLEVTAEGVEDAETAAALAELGCDQLQGYHYSAALPQTAFVAWLESYRCGERQVLATGDCSAAKR